MASLIRRNSSTADVGKRHASVTFSDSSTLINEEEVVTPPAQVFPNGEAGSRVVLADPFIDDEEDYDEEELTPLKKLPRSQSRISDFRDHNLRAPSTRDPSKEPGLKRSSSASMKPLKFSSADGRAYGTVSHPRGRRRSSGTMCSICRLERKSQQEPAAPASRAAFIMFLVVMNIVFLVATIFCIAWPAMRNQWDKTGCVVVPVSLWLAFILVTASSWRILKTCKCPVPTPSTPPTSSTQSRNKRRQGSGPLLPKPYL